MRPFSPRLAYLFLPLLLLFAAAPSAAQSFAVSGPVVGGENGPNLYGQMGRTGPFSVIYTGPTTTQSYTVHITDGGLGGTTNDGGQQLIDPIVFPSGTVTGASIGFNYYVNHTTTGSLSDNGLVTFTATPVAPAPGPISTFVYIAQKTLTAPPTGWDYAVPITVTAGAGGLAILAHPTTLELDLRSSAVVPPIALTEASANHTYLTTAPDGSAIDSTTYAGSFAGYRADVAIFYNGVQIDAELNECNAVNSIVSFPLQAAIAAGATDTGYVLVFGKASATAKCSLANIYWASSNFPSALTTGTTAGTWTVTSTTPTVSANVLTLSQSTNPYTSEGAFFYVPGGNPTGFNAYDFSVQMMNSVASGSSYAALTIGNAGAGFSGLRLDNDGGNFLDFGQVFNYTGEAESRVIFQQFPAGVWTTMEFSQPTIALTSELGQAWQLGVKSKPFPGALIPNANTPAQAASSGYNFVGFQPTLSGTTSLRYLRIRQALVVPPVIAPVQPTVPFVLVRATAIVPASQPGASVPAWSDAFIAAAYQNVIDLTTDTNLPSLMSTANADNVAAINADMIWASYMKTPCVFKLPPGDYRLATSGGIRWRSNVILEGAGYNNDVTNPLDGKPLTTISGPDTLITYERSTTNSGLFRIGMNVTNTPVNDNQHTPIYTYSSAQVNNIFLKNTTWNIGNNPGSLSIGNGTYPTDHTYLPALNVAIEDNTITSAGGAGALQIGSTDGLLINNNWLIYNNGRTQVFGSNHFLFSNNHMIRSGGFNGIYESRYLECSMNRNGSVFGNIGNLTSPRYANFFGWGEGMDAQDDGGAGPNQENFHCQGVVSSYNPATSTLTADTSAEPATNGYAQNNPTLNTRLPWVTAYVSGGSNVQTQGWNNADGPLNVLINTGAYAGQWHRVVSHTANTVTTDLPFPALAPGTRFSISTWVAENITFDSNQLNDGLVVQLYSGGYGVNFTNNILTNDGPLVLQGWVEDARFEPIWNCSASGNIVTQPDGYGPSNIALSVINNSGGYRGIATMGNRIFSNKLGTHPPWETRTLFNLPGAFDGVARAIGNGSNYVGMEQFGDALFPGETGGIGPVPAAVSAITGSGVALTVIPVGRVRVLAWSKDSLATGYLVQLYVGAQAVPTGAVFTTLATLSKNAADYIDTTTLTGTYHYKVTALH